MPKSKDPAVNEAYDHSGTTYDFYTRVFDRNSLDDAGMTLISSRRTSATSATTTRSGTASRWPTATATAVIFSPLHRSLDVVGHELTHGVVESHRDLEYPNESGALNEHFADVFGVAGQAVEEEADGRRRPTG